MEITDENERKKVLSKISKKLNIDEYYDINVLTSEEFKVRYGYWGFSFRKYYEIRFYKETNVLTQLKKLTTFDNQYYFFPIDKERRIYKDNIDFLDNLFGKDHLKAHVIIADEKLNWFLVKDNFNKLIGIGDYAIKSIKKMIHLKYDNEKIMHSTCDDN